MARGDLTTEQWAAVHDLMPASGGRGRPWRSHRTVVNGILWKHRTGRQWREMPSRYGPWETVYTRFRRWSDDGTWAKILERLGQQADQHPSVGT